MAGSLDGLLNTALVLVAQEHSVCVPTSEIFRTVLTEPHDFIFSQLGSSLLRFADAGPWIGSVIYELAAVPIQNAGRRAARPDVLTINQERESVIRSLDSFFHRSDSLH